MRTDNGQDNSAAQGSGEAQTSILVLTDNAEAAAQAMGEIVPASLSGRVKVTYKVVDGSLSRLSALSAQTGGFDWVLLHFNNSELADSVKLKLGGIEVVDISDAAKAAGFAEELARGV